MKKWIVISLMFVVLSAMKTDKPAYILLNEKGKQIKYSQLLQDASRADVVLFGELHKNPICHWLQFELTKDLYEIHKGNLVLGAEMFERDDQLLIDEYLAGTIKEKNFKQESKIWPNYKTDYKPLMEFAKENEIRFIGCNIPRRYASVVYNSGFEGLKELSEEALTYIAPLDIPYDPELEGYKSMLDMGEDMESHVNENLPKAQAVKDATMAHSIIENLDRGQIMLHFNGTYHSDDFEGIVWYLKKYKPSLKIFTISSAEVEDFSETEELSKANVRLLVTSSMTQTH